MSLLSWYLQTGQKQYTINQSDYSLLAFTIPSFVFFKHIVHNIKAGKYWDIYYKFNCGLQPCKMKIKRNHLLSVGLFIIKKSLWDHNILCMVYNTGNERKSDRGSSHTPHSNIGWECCT